LWEMEGGGETGARYTNLSGDEKDAGWTSKEKNGKEVGGEACHNTLSGVYRYLEKRSKVKIQRKRIKQRGNFSRAANI